MSEEQEKKLEEEIMRKLSTIDQVLNKAKAKGVMMVEEGDSQEEVKGIVSKRREEKAKEEEKGIDLSRVFMDDSELKTKSPAMIKLRKIKKECKDQMREVEK